MAHFYKEIGKRIKKLREDKGYTCQELAVLLDEDASMIEQLEQGRKRIFVDHISKIAEIFDVTVDYLIYGDKLF